MKRRSICWLTADYFIDCDAFVVPGLLKDFDITWYLLEGKTSAKGNKGIKESLIRNHPDIVTTITFQHRYRDPRIIFHYLSLLRMIQRNKPDLIYIAFNGIPYFMPLVRMILGSRRILFASHNTTTPKGAVNGSFALFYQRYILKTFRKFHVFSLNQKSALERKYQDKEVYYAPLTLKDYGPSQQKPDPVTVGFLYFGIIREYKRVDLLIQAACNVFERTGKTFKVTIAGSCDDWEPYQRLIRYPELFALNIKTIPDDQVADLFCRHHYFVQPYQDGTQSGTLKIAFQYNVPIIASDIDAFKEFIEDGTTGYLFESESVASLESVLLEALTRHSEHYEQMRRRQLEFIERECSTESILDKYREFLNVA